VITKNYKKCMEICLRSTAHISENFCSILSYFHHNFWFWKFFLNILTKFLKIAKKCLVTSSLEYSIDVPTDNQEVSAWVNSQPCLLASQQHDNCFLKLRSVSMHESNGIFLNIQNTCDSTTFYVLPIFSKTWQVHFL